MPSSNFIDGRPKPPPPEAHEHQLPCPRCDSTNTKFCYYNNYNLAQPRHFCKACRRYWTHGGTLRNVPIGGGTRKNSTKRPRTMSSTTTSPTSSASNNNNNTTSYDPISATPVSSQYPTMTDRHHPHSHHTHHQQQQQHLIPLRHDVDLNDAGNVSSGVGSLGFTSLLQSQGPNGFLALGGFGLGFEDLGLAGIWPSSYGEISDGGIATHHHHHHTATGVVGLGTGGGATWQFGNGGDLGFGDSDGGFAWPELAISTTTPRKSIK